MTRDVFRRFCLIAASLTLAACGTAPAAVNDPFDGADEYMSRPLVRGVSYDPRSERTFFALCPEREYACQIVHVRRDADVVTPLALAGGAPLGYAWPSVSPDGRRLITVRSPEALRADEPDTIAQDLVEIDLETGVETVLARHAGLLFNPVYIDDDHFAYFASDALVPVRGCVSACAHVARSVSLVVRDRERERARIDGFDAGATGGRLAHAGGGTVLVDAWSYADDPIARRLRAILVTATAPYFTEFPTPAAAVEAIPRRIARPAAWVGHRPGPAASRPTLAPFLDADAGLSFGTNVDLLEDGATVHIRKVERRGRTGFRIVFRRLSQTGWVEDRAQTVFLS